MTLQLTKLDHDNPPIEEELELVHSKLKKEKARGISPELIAYGGAKLQIQEVHPGPHSNACNFCRFYLYFHTWSYFTSRTPNKTGR